MFKEIREMIMDNKWKHFRKMFKYGDISILTKLRVVIFVNWNNNSLFPE
jgi:hypothetical protein